MITLYIIFIHFSYYSIHSTYDYHKKYRQSSLLLPENMYFSIRWQNVTKKY